MSAIIRRKPRLQIDFGVELSGGLDLETSSSPLQRPFQSEHYWRRAACVQ